MLGIVGCLLYREYCRLTVETRLRRRVVDRRELALLRLNFGATRALDAVGDQCVFRRKWTAVSTLRN